MLKESVLTHPTTDGLLFRRVNACSNCADGTYGTIAVRRVAGAPLNGHVTPDWALLELPSLRSAGIPLSYLSCVERAYH